MQAVLYVYNTLNSLLFVRYIYLFPKLLIFIWPFFSREKLPPRPQGQRSEPENNRVSVKL